MTKLEMHVHFRDHSSRVTKVERDDPVGRRAIDKAAFAEMSRDNVTYVSVKRVQRTAQKG